ncbi:lysophospholipid acyltransferase family protein [Allofustis seminis]|uniref:lysophospholipid acyltransferase family protein n=1 Tax=Allofustis seminis TaxID=166939 RepID=UPI00036B4347|nr:1-acyl-sn-glycerol-3-phosphate acyltransferase [Allofustis seminis]
MYAFLFFVVRCLLLLLNGPIKIEGRDNLPQDESFILVAPHHSWIDPVMLAVAAYPRRFMFMAKKELFEYPILGWLIRKVNAFPVDRENPQVSSIKTPINALKKDELNLIIFPTGSRHSSEIKGGATVIARLSKRQIVPAIYKGPLTFSKLLTRQQTVVKFGEPFYVEKKIEGIDDPETYYNEKIDHAFKQLGDK